MRKFITLTLITLLLCSNIASAASGFSDLREGHWAFRAVSTLVDCGGISGYPDGTFKPSGTITVAEFVKIAVGVTAGAAAPSGAHWASGYFDKALDTGLIAAGEYQKDDWGRPITRQQMALIISRAAEKVLGEDITAPDRDAVIAQISDFALICPNCKDAVINVYSVGIITGYPDGTFKGANTATRAEASAMLVRMLDKSQRAGALTVKISDYISNWGEYRGLFENIDDAVFISDVSSFNFSATVILSNLISADAGLFKPIAAAIIDGKIVEVKGPINPINGRTSYHTDLDPASIEFFFSYSRGYNDAVIFPNPLYKDNR